MMAKTPTTTARKSETQPLGNAFHELLSRWHMGFLATRPILQKESPVLAIQKGHENQGTHAMEAHRQRKFDRNELPRRQPRT